ncbi:DNA_MISMATCH_REPAIR_2 domain-containing protein [Haematococcus lacustris]|uniref:DNA_MISMATCH_REPAIR_2 domain-containing protein n=1 Tax=Haematococcus lacustris TaxID=44745 RepID=A0A699ZXR9_HAELA|nr:DNA_MISMATCH_REPAIR_2 domain-containing protein [Haematococcus lacustris]
MYNEQSRALDQQDSSFSPGITLHSLTELRLSGCLVLDPCTLSALQIFHKERHASQMGLGQPKEGFSLFTLLQRCVTQM